VPRGVASHPKFACGGQAGIFFLFSALKTKIAECCILLNMETNQEKEYLRKLSADDWIREMKERAERGEFEPWVDLITVEDYRRTLEKYFGNLDVLAGKKYLDIGAGFGSKLHELLKQLGVEIMNIDIGLESVKFLKEKREDGVIGDVFKLPVQENGLDGAIAVNLINTGSAMDREDLEGIFKEIHRALKEKGHLIQSHFGYFVQPIPKDEQLAAVVAAGFKNIQLIQNQLTSKLAHLEPLAFIAEKAESK